VTAKVMKNQREALSYSVDNQLLLTVLKGLINNINQFQLIQKAKLKLNKSSQRHRRHQGTTSSNAI